MKKKGYAMGGMMKSKGMAKGGAMKKKGYAMGGSAKKFPDLSGDQSHAKRYSYGPWRCYKKKAGGMMKKKGYSKGGTVRKGKRGMGAATRGGGAIM